MVLCFSEGEAPRGATASTALAPLPVEAAYFAAGTGSDRLDVAAATRAFADKPMALDGTTLEKFVEHILFNAGTFTDFQTEKEKPKCRLHIFVDIVRDGASVAALFTLLDLLLPYELPLGLHAILSGPDKTAYFSMNPILDRVGDKMPVLTMAGAEHALGPDVEWDKVLETYRALVVLFEGDVYESFDHALSDNYANERLDVGLPPVRLGEFDGITGDLRLDFPAPPGAPPEPPWEWRSDDLGLIVSSRGDHMDRLIRILTRSGLPDDVAKMVTIRGRPVKAFDTSSLMALVPMRGAPLRSLLDTRAERSLVEICAAAGKRWGRFVDARHEALGTFSFDGDRELALGATVKPDANGAIAAAALAVEGTDVLIVAAGEGDVEPLRAAVASAGGALLVVGKDTLSLFGDGLALTADAGAHRDVFATVLDLAGVDSPAPSARSLVAK